MNPFRCGDGITVGWCSGSSEVPGAVSRRTLLVAVPVTGEIDIDTYDSDRHLEEAAS